MSASEHPVDDINPDKDDVLQVEDPDPQAVEVRIVGPAKVQQLPHKGGSTRTRTIGTTPVRMLSADHRRARAVLMSVGANALFALGKEQAADPSTMALWPQNVSFVVTTDTEVWAAAATGTTSMSVMTELWAEGNSES